MRKDKLSGVQINLLNMFFTVLTAIVFCFILIISNTVNKRFHAVEVAINKFITCEQSSEMIKESSNYLTDQARLFVVTHQIRYARQYLEELEITKRQNRALENIEAVCDEKDLALQRLKIAMEQAQSLITMELYAMRLSFKTIDDAELPWQLKDITIRNADSNLTKTQLQDTAINNLFGEGYLIYKTRINQNCSLTIEAIEQQIKDELNMNAEDLGENLRRLRILFLTLLVINVLIFIAFGYLVIIPLERFQKAIQNDEKLTIIGSAEFKQLAKSYNEIYDIKRKNEKSLLQKAEYDALTGILNRRAFDQICQNSAEKQQSIALLLIDMDNFKYINDNYGHAGGDTALKELARILSETFRKHDYVARIGGDEFAAILTDCDLQFASTIKNKITQVNEQLANIKDGIKPVSVSVGIAFSAVGFTEALYKNADAALYKVKEKGKRGCEVYEIMVATASA